MSESAAALIVAAGAGTRFGGPQPKVFAPLAGQPLLTYSLRAFDGHPQISHLCVVASPEHLDRTRELCAVTVQRCDCRVVAGGAQRQASVARGLQALADLSPTLVAIHDGARPLVSPAVITEALAVAGAQGAAVPVLPCSDTVKELAPTGTIARTLDRHPLRLAQTPQTFRYELICRAHEQAAAEGWEVTDDAMMVERLGEAVYPSAGEARNLKITHPEDLALAEWLLGAGAPGAVRVGHGYDLHRLVEGRALVLGGVTVPHERGLLGHSDADVALHALCDALLGAAGLGDIGRHFPDTDPAYAGADSLDLTRRVVAMLAEAGWQPLNADVTLVAQRPRLAPHVALMRERSAAALGLPPEAVNYKATTTEGLGPEGEGLAISAHAVVTVRPQGF
jgi:2-C-methyl-D-erythritol 4-phosphate cytidylyltransferase/2-C-methyl-D-erythritol 2,4-cyclodiphosphate synthase